MPRRIEGRGAIEVYPTQHGQIAIKQIDSYPGEEESTVILDVNDVPTIIKWLQEVATDAEEIRQAYIEDPEAEPANV